MTTPDMSMELILERNPRQVWAATVGNWRWIAGVGGLALTYCCASATLFQYLDPRGLARWDGAPVQSFPSALYFTVINVTTVGFGDIRPTSAGGMMLAAANSVFGVVLFGLLVAVLSAAMQPQNTEVRRRPAASTGPVATADARAQPADAPVVRHEYVRVTVDTSDTSEKKTHTPPRREVERIVRELTAVLGALSGDEGAGQSDGIRRRWDVDIAVYAHHYADGRATNWEWHTETDSHSLRTGESGF